MLGSTFEEATESPWHGSFRTSQSQSAYSSLPCDPRSLDIHQRRIAVWVASDSINAVDEFSSRAPDIDVFSLGRSSHRELRSCSPISEYNQSTWNELPIEQRVLETRGMIVDLAMLAGAWSADSLGSWAPEASICALFVCRFSIRSAACRSWRAQFHGLSAVSYDFRMETGFRGGAMGRDRQFGFDGAHLVAL